MLAVVGTVPDANFPLLSGQVNLEDDAILIGGVRTPVERGTPALLAAALMASRKMRSPAPFAYLVGDIGLGDGSRRLYKHLTLHLHNTNFRTVVFHYLQPDVDWHNRILFTMEAMDSRPVLIADAGFMYAAKMSGQSAAYDLFTPDLGELAFLADEMAPHPFYTRGFILHQEERVVELIDLAYSHDNAARYLLVKGRVDYVTRGASILWTIDHPAEEAMEAIGGTGDTLTGIVAALIDSGMEIGAAAATAAHANRLAGHRARPTPATQIREIVPHIAPALTATLKA